ncbi:type II toxin-antitoxin system VapC family toxin [Aquidulcibacter sp.]|jgi:predicted nucleic acid-binding protein|uniref:type II toxin-antitoxin system VapC family toxin n=1 Tax=Aquidulcibacter sp. TaxID=2052990 RepID=UPI003BA5E789
MSGLYLLDTSVAIEVRDRSQAILGKLEGLSGRFAISVITRVELEGGVHREASSATLRRQRLDVFLSHMPVLPFEEEDADRYGGILQSCGFSRRKILDRMIAAQALNAKATLVTLNPQDFEEVTGLQVLGW